MSRTKMTDLKALLRLHLPSVCTAICSIRVRGLPDHWTYAFFSSIAFVLTLNQSGVRREREYGREEIPQGESRSDGLAWIDGMLSAHDRSRVASAYMCVCVVSYSWFSLFWEGAAVTIDRSIEQAFVRVWEKVRADVARACDDAGIFALPLIANEC